MSDQQLKSIIERILRLHQEEDELKADRREVYAEAKANGYDKTALGDAVRIIRKREKDAAGFEERNAIVDLYLSAFDGTSHVHTPAPARTREEREKDRLSEAMADNKELSAEMVRGGLITPEAHAENVALSDAVATKLGSGIAKPIGASVRHQDCRPHCKKPDACGSATLDHCFTCKQALAASEREAA